MFIFAELFIYITYLYLDLNNSLPEVSSLLKFISVCLCFLFVSYRHPYIKIAMFLTVISDFFLVITPFYTIGVLFFILVQLQYYKYITKKARFPWEHLSLVCIAGFLVSLCINFFILPIDFVTFLSCVYFINLITNICLCMSMSKHSAEYQALTLCLFLIMLCDIHVGVTNIFSTGLWYNFGLIAMWLFYLPSQVLIALLYSTNTQRRYSLL